MSDAFDMPKPPTSHMKRNLDNDFVVIWSTDGTVTNAEVLLRQVVGDPVSIGWGQARRHKGDVRNGELGAALALSRALRMAGDNYEAKAKELLGDG
jgi:hypothetical protein